MRARSAVSLACAILIIASTIITASVIFDVRPGRLGQAARATLRACGQNNRAVIRVAAARVARDRHPTTLAFPVGLGNSHFDPDGQIKCQPPSLSCCCARDGRKLASHGQCGARPSLFSFRSENGVSLFEVPGARRSDHRTNGAGKTTLRTMIGLQKWDSGRAHRRHPHFCDVDERWAVSCLRAAGRSASNVALTGLRVVVGRAPHAPSRSARARRAYGPRHREVGASTWPNALRDCRAASSRSDPHRPALVADRASSCSTSRRQTSFPQPAHRLRLPQRLVRIEPRRIMARTTRRTPARRSRVALFHSTHGWSARHPP